MDITNNIETQKNRLKMLQNAVKAKKSSTSLSNLYDRLIYTNTLLSERKELLISKKGLLNKNLLREKEDCALNICSKSSYFKKIKDSKNILIELELLELSIIKNKLRFFID